ncbi:transcriptional repressor [Podochytrium sp. JEL0797]|nr:transcriptional repressor [Podochytrium sp. JEL0797]
MEDTDINPSVTFRAKHRFTTNHLELIVADEHVPDTVAPPKTFEHQPQLQILEPIWQPHPAIFGLLFGDESAIAGVEAFAPAPFQLPLSFLAAIENNHEPINEPTNETDSDNEPHSNAVSPNIIQIRTRQTKKPHQSTTPKKSSSSIPRHCTKPKKATSSTARNPDQGGYLCEICGTTLASASHHSRHMRSHYGVLPYVCKLDTCNRRFNRKDNMLQHYASHFKQRKNACGRKYKIEDEHEGAWEYEGGLESVGKNVAKDFWSQVTTVAPIVNDGFVGRRVK